MIDNVITVTIGNSRKVTSRPVWLTDKGMILKFIGIELPNYYVVDFARSVTDEALPVIGDAEGVAIPSELFHNADKIFAWLRITNGDNSHYTAYQVTIPLLQRSEISGSQPTPEQEDIIDQAIAALNEAGSEAAAAAESAAQSAAEIDAKLGGGGITGEEYVTMFGGEFTVTTETDATHEHPWARSSVTGRLDKRYRYRVTFDGVQYVLPSQLFGITTSDTSVRVVEYVGDISLFRLPDDGLLNEPFEVPFLVVSEDDPYIEYVDVYTSEAGTHTVLVERQVVEFEKLLNELMYGNAHAPFQWMKPEKKYDYFSVGANFILNSANATAFALGIANVLAGAGAFATGWGNEASNTCSFSCGQMNKSSGSRAFTEGFHNIATGNNSHAEGQRNIVSGGVGHVEGDGNRSYAVGAHVEGSGNVADATQLFTHIGGVNNATSNESGKTVDITRYNEDGTVNSTTTRALGKYAEVIGNGESDQARSNARTLDWDGNEGLAGGLTLGMGTEDEIHITPAQLKALLNLI